MQETDLPATNAFKGNERLPTVTCLTCADAQMWNTRHTLLHLLRDDRAAVPELPVAAQPHSISPPAGAAFLFVCLQLV